MGISLHTLKPTSYKVIETTDQQMPDGTGFVKTPFSDVPKNTIKRIEIEEGVTSIGYHFFSDLHSLVSVKLPSTLKSIGTNSFSFCTSLEEIDIPEEVEHIEWYAFCGCHSLRRITLPSTLKSIGKGAFEMCTSLKEIVLPDGLELIGVGAFDSCTSLRRIEIPGTVKRIQETVFIRCSSLSDVIIHEGVQSIHPYAFLGCHALEKIQFPKSFCKIEAGRDFFEPFHIPLSDTLLYKSLTGDFIIINNILLGYKGSDNIVTIPDGVKQIIPYAFYGQTSIFFVKCPEGLERIEEYAFAKSTSLLGIELPDSLEYLGNNVFDNCTSLSSVKLPGSIKEVNYGAFFGCTSLQRARLGKGIKQIDTDAFYYCTSLSELILPDGLERIEDLAFYNCTSLVNLSIPNSATEIGYDAFIYTPWYNHLSTPSIVGDNVLLKCCDIEMIDIIQTVIIPDNARNISEDLFVHLQEADVDSFKFHGCVFENYMRYYSNKYINYILHIVVTKNYDDKTIPIEIGKRLEIANTVWEQTGQPEALDYLNSHGREFSSTQ